MIELRDEQIYSPSPTVQWAARIGLIVLAIYAIFTLSLYIEMGLNNDIWSNIILFVLLLGGLGLLLGIAYIFVERIISPRLSIRPEGFTLQTYWYTVQSSWDSVLYINMNQLFFKQPIQAQWNKTSFRRLPSPRFRRLSIELFVTVEPMVLIEIAQRLRNEAGM